jgi:hypothetical protein
MIHSIVELLNAIVSAFERLLAAINTRKKFFVFFSLSLFCLLLWLIYPASQEISSEFTTTRIERVDTCYQQSVRLNRRIIAVQYPIPDDLVKQGAVQVLSAVVIKDYPTIERFNALCQGLIRELSNRENDIRWFQYNPALKEKVQEFYKDLDKPSAGILHKSDIEAQKNQ